MTTNTTNSLRFANSDQVNLFNLEILGQLSDGQWENSSPRNHWRPWSSANVSVDAARPGRTFYADKDNYNLVSSELLSIIGNRMILIVKLGHVVGSENIEMLKYAFNEDSGKLAGLPTYQGTYWDEIRTKLSMFDLVKIAAAVEADTYNMKSLKNDLKQMKLAMRTQL